MNSEDTPNLLSRRANPSINQLARQRPEAKSIILQDNQAVRMEINSNYSDKEGIGIKPMTS